MRPHSGRTAQREGRLARQQAANLQNLFESMGKEEQTSVNLLIRADVQGSVEALRDALTSLSNDDVKVNIVASGVGAITENDASLAQASGAIIIGFNVRADATARKVIQEHELDLHYYSVIYDAIDEVKKAITGLLGTESQGTDSRSGRGQGCVPFFQAGRHCRLPGGRGCRQTGQPDSRAAR